MPHTSTTPRQVFAIVDCDAFYCSCEVLFRPELARKPVVVLSNNDGCVIARNRQGDLRQFVKMGMPYFQCREVLESIGAAVFSSNYALYAVCSGNVMDCLRTFSPLVEVYSIDEAFLDLSGLSGPDLTDYARLIRDTVKQHTGIPVSIGIGTTKTLAKIAVEKAKKEPLYAGVVNLTDFSADEIEEVLAETPVRDVWGIGSRRTELLQGQSIYSALQLREANDRWVRKAMTVTGLRTVWELRGISCLPLELAPPPKTAIISSRSFGRPVSSLAELKEAVATYMSRACEKLRAQHSVASTLQVFIHTSFFKPSAPFYNNTMTLNLPVATSYTPELVATACRGLEKIYRPGYEYVKAGVMLSGIVPDGRYQLSLFCGDNNQLYKQRVGAVLDEVNHRYGRDTLKVAATGLVKEWQTKRARVSPSYLTRWNELPKVRAT